MKNKLVPSVLAVSSLFLMGWTSLNAQQTSLFQELGVFAISARSDHVELPSPAGFGVASTWEFA